MSSFLVKWKIKFLSRAIIPYSKRGLYDMKKSQIQLLEAPLV